MKELEKYSKETDVAVLRSLFGAVPIVGGLLNEIIFDIRGRIKQERLNKFIEMFAEYFVGRTDFDHNALKTEDFGDLLESVLKRVVLTKSEAKYKRYKSVLVNQIEHNFLEINNSDRYLELIATLDEMEIFILFSHKVFDSEFLREKEDLSYMKQERDSLKENLKKEMKLSYEGYANNKSSIKLELDKISSVINELESRLNDLNIYREAEFYKIKDNQFIFFKQNLYSKALLVDVGIGTYGYIPFAQMGITEFGKEFLQFLNDKK